MGTEETRSGHTPRKMSKTVDEYLDGHVLTLFCIMCYHGFPQYFRREEYELVSGALGFPLTRAEAYL